MLEQQARNQNRHGAEDDEPAHLGIRIVRAHAAFEVLTLLAEQGAKPSTENTDDVVTEIQNHGKLGANLNNGGKRGARVRSQHQIADDADVSTGRNRQVLGQCLHQPKENRLEEIHEPSFTCINGFVCFSAFKTSERGLIFHYGSLSCLKPCTQWCQNLSESRQRLYIVSQTWRMMQKKGPAL